MRSPGATPAAARGVDIIQNCPVTAIRRGPDGGSGRPRPPRASSPRRRSQSRPPATPPSVMETAGFGCRSRSYPLRRWSPEPIKPIFPCVVDVERGARLYQPVRQGRTRHRFRAPTSTSATPPARGLPLIEHPRRDLRDLPDLPPHADAAKVGRHRRHDARPLGHPQQDAGSGPLRGCGWGTGGIQSHRPAMSSPGRWPRTSLTRSTRPSRWSASPGRLIGKAAAAAVAH